jgi:biopolymer transport protein ExbB/TolQ
VNALLELFEKAGPVMIAIVGLSVLLYARCFDLLLWIYAQRRLLDAGPWVQSAGLAALRRRKQELRETFRDQRMVLGAMIAAAPLLGLLGTVSGMVTTFESLSNRVGQKSMEGLAKGISEVLVATESGLAVAIPAMLLVYLAHWAVHQNIKRLNELEVIAQENPPA